MKPGKVRFEFLKTNKGNWVINYDSPDVGFNLHGKPEYVKQMYENMGYTYAPMPRITEFDRLNHYLFEREFDVEVTDERED